MNELRTPTVIEAETSKALKEAINRSLQTPESRQQINTIKQGFNITDTVSVLQFGTQPQQQMAEFADTVLDKVKVKDSGQAGELLTNLMGNVKSLNVEGISEPGFASRIPLIGSLFDSFKKFMEGFESVSGKIDGVVAELEKEKFTMLRDIEMLDRLYDENLKLLGSLDIYIAAGEELHQELKEKTLPAARTKASDTEDALDAQKVRDLDQMITRLEKKIHDLKLNRNIAIQNAPQIRLAQEGDKTLAEKLQSSLFHTIPLWKSQMVMAISLYRQKRALGVQKEVTDTTNELLKQNADLLHQNSTEIARETERGIVDIETLKETNQKFIQTIEETLAIQKEGRERRKQAEGELIKIETELKQRLTQVSEEV